LSKNEAFGLNPSDIEMSKKKSSPEEIKINAPALLSGAGRNIGPSVV
jgi:hypothetical protein